MPDEGEKEKSDLDEARLAIARLALAGGDQLEVALQCAAGISGRTLGVDFVGVWLFDAHRLVLTAEYRRESTTPRRPTSLSLERWPHYDAAIRSSRILAAADAVNDPRCVELDDEYLAPFGVGALLDAAVFAGGEVVGIVCHEHAGGPRAWQPHECAFAGAVADMLTALFEQARRLRAEEELRVRERQLARARRREMLAQVSAGVAHDFRNALQVIITSVSMARREEDTERRTAMLDAALEEAHRANRLTRQLTDLARGRDVVRAPLEVANVLDALAPTLERIAEERDMTLDVDVRAEARGLRVSAEQTLLERAVQNLVMNAVEASPPGDHVEVTLARDGDRLVLDVCDRGPGVAPELTARVFDPFFTTKEMGGGTGLGLAIVALAAELFGGEVVVHPRVGGGARFVVTLPLRGDGDEDEPGLVEADPASSVRPGVRP